MVITLPGARPKSALKGINKAATLLVALGPEASASVLKVLNEREIESLTGQVAAMNQVSSTDLHSVIEEGHGMTATEMPAGTGGVDYARAMLQLALGPDQAEPLIKRVTSTPQSVPFDFLRRSDPKRLATFLENEHPQTIALVLSHVPPGLAASVLTQFSLDLQTDVARRVATMDPTPPEIVRRVDEVMRRRLSAAVSQTETPVGGTDHLVALLATADAATEKRILERLEEIDPDLAEQIRRQMFTFDDLSLLDDRSVQRVLRDVDTRDLALALKAASDDLREHIFSNMSSRAAQMLREEIELLGPTRIRTIEEAQQRIIAVVRRLEDDEQIVIAREREQLLG